MGSLMIFGSIMLFIQVCFPVWGFSVKSLRLPGREYCRIRLILFSFSGSFRGHVVHYQLSRRRDR